MDTAATSRSSPYCHVPRVSPKCLGIPLHPLQRRDLVCASVVPQCLAARLDAQLRMREESESAQTVIHGDNRDPLGNPLCPVIYWVGVRPELKRPHTKPDQNEPVVVSAFSAVAYVQVEAVLAELGFPTETQRRGWRRELKTAGTESPSRSSAPACSRWRAVGTGRLSGGKWTQ